jgi:alkylation response protein AidB-like acyl-CoA dehydrogenase
VTTAGGAFGPFVARVILGRSTVEEGRGVGVELISFDTDVAEAVRDRYEPFGDAYWPACEKAKVYLDELLGSMAESGWLGLEIPEEYGGGGQGAPQAGLMLYEIDSSGAGQVSCLVTYHSIFAAEPGVEVGSLALKEEFLPRPASDEIEIAFAVTEPNAGCDMSSAATIAAPSGGEHLLNGQKICITQADFDEVAWMLTRSSPASKRSWFCWFELVPGGAQGGRGHQAHGRARDARNETVDNATQTLGGMGYTREGQVERQRDLRVCRLSPSTPHDAAEQRRVVRPRTSARLLGSSTSADGSDADPRPVHKKQQASTFSMRRTTAT